MNTGILKSQKPLSDYVGLLSSFLCLAHCLIIPVFLSMQLLSLRFLKDIERYHYFDYIFLIVSTVAVYYSAKRFNDKLTSILLWSSLFTLATSILFHEIVPEVMAYFSSLVLIVIHLKNILLKSQKKKYVHKKA